MIWGIDGTCGNCGNMYPSQEEGPCENSGKMFAIFSFHV